MEGDNAYIILVDISLFFGHFIFLIPYCYGTLLLSMDYYHFPILCKFRVEKDAIIYMWGIYFGIIRSHVSLQIH